MRINNKQFPVMLIGPKSNNRITGMSLSFDLFLSGVEELKLPHYVVDLGSGISETRAGTFSIFRATTTIKIIYLFLKYILRVKVVYLTIGSSRPGFLRDAIIIWISKIFGRRIVLHLKGGGYKDFYRVQPRWFQYLIRLTIDQARRIIVLGELLRDQFYFIPDISDRLFIVPNGLPYEIQSEYIAPKCIPDKKPIRILYLSNMIESKGYMEVLLACKILYDRQIPFLCDFCGDFIITAVDKHKLNSNQAKKKFTNKIKKWGLSDYVNYHGVVTGQKKQQLLRNAHIFLLPTTYPWEGQPISIIEAMAFGTPIISSNHRGIPELVLDGYNGYLIDPVEPSQIADAIAYIWNNPDVFKELSQNALIHYQNNFTRQRHLMQLIPIIFGSKTEI